MRCKRHITDLSSTVGVCATCLRERLLSIIAAQSSGHHSSAHNQHRSRNQVHAQLLAAAASSLDQHRKSDFHIDRSLQLSKSDLPREERIVFPRSVSPYVLRGKKLCEDGDDDEDVVLPPDRRFYSTPQIGQMTNERERKHAHGYGGRFSFLSGWFRPRSDRSEFDFKLPSEPKPSTSSSSFSWFSSIRRKHKSKPQKTTATVNERLPRRVVVMDRGMTPERMSCVDADEFDHEPSSRMEFASDSCKRTPARSAKPSSNISGMAFCMSPLVRASPARLWNQKSVSTDLIGFSGEIRSAGNHPHLSSASSYCGNRSRKLVDFGRASHHH